MKALIVYESMFGNTREIAEAIASGFATRDGEAIVRTVDEVSNDDMAADILVVGAPTHAWGMPRRQSRQGAFDDATKHPDHVFTGDVQANGVREWLAGLPDQGGKRAAAFDTRLDKSKFVTGSAARRISRVLRRHGLRLFHPEHSFTVTGMNGPLAVGEVERARAWGAEMASTFVTAR